MQIGFIGIGIMGKPMALNLLKAGFKVTVHNRTPARCAPLVEAGAAQTNSPREVAERSDAIITIVPDTPDVEAVLFGSEGVDLALRPGQIIIDMSTISPVATRDFAKRVEEKGALMLDAPVTGGEKGAIEGTLSIMVGGQHATFERCLPLFQAMGRTIVHAGDNGQGQMTKLVNQILCAQHIVALCDALRFARLAKLDLEATLNAISGGAAGSWMLSNLGPRILRDDFAPGFMIKLQQKDLRLVREAVEQMDVTLPGNELAYDLFTKAVETGLGDQGTQGLINLFKDR